MELTRIWSGEGFGWLVLVCSCWGYLKLFSINKNSAFLMNWGGRNGQRKTNRFWFG